MSAAGAGLLALRQAVQANAAASGQIPNRAYASTLSGVERIPAAAACVPACSLGLSPADKMSRRPPQGRYGSTPR
jgi:hypothetical protein